MALGKLDLSFSTFYPTGKFGGSHRRLVFPPNSRLRVLYSVALRTGVNTTQCNSNSNSID
jgi:hypothetical protein